MVWRVSWKELVLNRTGAKRAAVVVAAGALIAVGLAAPASVAAGHDHLGNDTVGLHASMAYPHARGHVEWHAARDSRHAAYYQEFDVVLRGVRGLSGKRVRVIVNGVEYGRGRVVDGRAHMHRHAGMHTVHDGSRIRARTMSGTLVATARFHHDDHHDGHH